MSSLKTRTIIGRQPLVEAIQAGVAIDKILLQKNASGDVLNQIRLLSKEHNIPLQFVPIEKLNSVTRANHQGVIAFAAIVKYYSVQEVIDFTTDLSAVEDAINNKIPPPGGSTPLPQSIKVSEEKLDMKQS